MYRGLWTGGILTLLLAGCGQFHPLTNSAEMVDYTVRDGETLYSIAWHYGYDHREVAAWNNIDPPFLIHPGDHLYLIPPDTDTPPPLPDMEGEPRENLFAAAEAAENGGMAPSSDNGTPATATSEPSAPRKIVNTTAVVASLKQKVAKGLKQLKNITVQWAWPTSGKVVNTFHPAQGKKGLDLGGKLGQPIKAAADGVVVYSGSGLLGYGKLIIIKHNDTYLSAYGHNRELLVAEGKTVKRGERIADMGDSGKDGILLHFEIRRNGKPVDPMGYLPQKGH